MEVGQALRKIRDSRLFRDKYPTFAEYCRAQWEFSKTHANRQIGAAEVAAVLTPIGVIVDRESIVRPLFGRSPKEIQAAWKEAVKLAGDGKVKAKHVKSAVA